MSDPVIQWFPGHMAASMAKLAERLEIVDVVVEIADARLPRASTNPLLGEIARRRPCVNVLTRADLADPTITKRWIESYRALGREAVAVDAKHVGDLKQITAAVERMLEGKTGRVLIVGIPNSGKSTVINGLVGRIVARVENRAGVTRSLQWYRISRRLEIMDSPGILMPKIETAQAQWMLAITGAIPRERYDAQDVVARFHAYWHASSQRAGLPGKPPPDLETFAAARGFLRRGGIADLENASLAYLKTFNSGGFGRISFELPEEAASTATAEGEADDCTSD